MKKARIQLETFTCPSCLLKVEGALKGLNGVDEDSIKVSFNSSRAQLSFDDSLISIEEIEEAITKVGYEVENSRVR